MPHIRARHILPLLLKKLKFSPIVAIQGARQTGKSFLVRELLNHSLPLSSYTTLDQNSVREFAALLPGTFLEQHLEAHPLIIDETQKVPPLFDEIKFQVDRDRRPGRYLLLGSTEFSKLSRIRESLTGRMAKIRLFPMNMAETLELPANPSKSPILANKTPRSTRAQLLKYLEMGGMPGIFSVRSRSEAESLLQDWLDLTTQRDALLFPPHRIDPDICIRILEKVATLEEPDAGNIARSLKRDLRRVKTHLSVLTNLFVLNPLPPHPDGTGKTRYFLCDVAFARLLGGDFERQLYTWLVQEQLSQRTYRDDRETKLCFYRTTKGSLIHLALIHGGKTEAVIKIFSEERILGRDLEILKAFGRKHPTTLLRGLGASHQIHSKEKIEIHPWESIT